MKKRTISLILCLSVISSIMAQDCKYENYNYWTGRATINYSENKFQEANRNFKLAFTKAEFPFGNDLALALKTASKTKDTIWTETLSIALAKGGIPLKYFDSLKNMSWFPHFETEFHKYHKSYKEEFDVELGAKILRLRYEDSLFNENYHEWRKGERDMSLGELIEGAKTVTNGFKHIIKEHGFPCEQSMGYYFKDGEVQQYPITILLIHIYQRGELLYKDRLDRIVCDGMLKPIDQASLNRFRGFGDSTGIEQEMKIRYSKYRPKN